MNKGVKKNKQTVYQKKIEKQETLTADDFDSQSESDYNEAKE